MAFRWCCLSWLLVLGGCSRPLAGPNLGGLYDMAAMHQDDMRNPVVVIPGILGSKLIDGETNRVVWGAFGGKAANPQRPSGARLVAMPMSPGAALADLTDGVRPDGVLDRARLDLIGLPIQLNAYANILATLGVGGYRDQQLAEAGAVDYGSEHYTCFQFAYDWRRDIVESARRLHEFLLEKRTHVRQQRARRHGGGLTPPRFDIVAHSMGGLVTRYYLRYGTAELEEALQQGVTWAGAELVERAILIGTPSAGSVKAVHQLVEGAEFAAIIPKYEPAVIGTMPAVYQLLPRDRHGRVVDAADHAKPITGLYDPEFWQRMGWGLADPRQQRYLKWLLPDVADPEARRRIALEHQRKCLRRARLLAEALDAPARKPAGLKLYLFAGDAVPTAGRAAVDLQTGRLRTIDHAPGDGTVTRASALMDERLGSEWTPRLKSPIDWTHVTLMFSDHLGLTKDPAFADNVLHILLEQQP